VAEDEQVPGIELGEQVEVVEEPVELVERAAAIDVAKDSGMVCTRVPHESRGGRRVQKVWQVPARFDAVTELADHLRCLGIERVVLEATGAYWRIWFYLLESAGLVVWLVNPREVKNVPGRPKTDKLDAVWLCKLNERGMLRPSFVPPEPIRQLRDYTRLRATLVADCAAYKQRVEKILEDSLIKVSSVASELFGMSGRAMLKALVAGERDPKALAGLAQRSLKAKNAALIEAFKGRFTEHHAYQIGMLIELVEDLEARIADLDRRIEAHITAGIPAAAAPVCTSCGVTGDLGGPPGALGGVGDDAGGGVAGHAPGCEQAGTVLMSLIDRLDEIPGVGRRVAWVILAEVGWDADQFPTAGHLGSWAKLTPRTIQSGGSSKGGRTGKGNRWLRSALGDAAMAGGKTDTFLGARHRKIRRRRGKQKALVATGRAILEITHVLLGDPTARYHDLGSDYHERRDPDRQRRAKIRELERLTGMKVTLTTTAAATA
jgi:transposase